MRHSWVEITKRAVQQHADCGEPMSYTLPVEQAVDCHICGNYIKEGTEIIWELVGRSQLPFCSTECWIQFGDRTRPPRWDGRNMIWRER